MKKLSLLIVDSDEEYLLSLSNFISTKYFNEFKITSISDESYFKEYLETVQGIDILLVNGSFYYEDLKEKYINTIIILKDEAQNERKDCLSIFKYMNATKIYNEIKNCYIQSNPDIKESIGSKDTKVTCVYSPLGGSGKSTIAVSMLLKLKENNEDVLYLNFEDIPSTPLYFTCTNSNSMSDILYMSKDRNDNIKLRILEYLKQDKTGIYYFEPVNNIIDYETITREDIMYFVKTLRNLNKFDHIIMDMSSKFGSIYGGLLSSADIILTILGSDLNSKIKGDEFLKQQESLDKFVFIINKYRNNANMSNLPDILIENLKKITSTIEYYQLYDGNFNGVDMLLEKNPFTLAVEQLVENLYF